MNMNRVFVALDQLTLDEIKSLLNSSQGKIKSIKIGLELFLKYGPEVVSFLKHDFGVNIFLDLKIHDIPVTVEKAIQSLYSLPIDFLTIHLSGGETMINHALKSADKYLPNTKLLGVSFLTSLETSDTQKVFGIDLNDTAFTRMFNLANTTNLHGVVCSPKELSLLKKINPNIIAVTPGVRFAFEIENNLNIEDQKRILSIEDTFKNGADYIVLGRSLTKTKDQDELLSRIEIIEKI